MRFKPRGHKTGWEAKSYYDVAKNVHYECVYNESGNFKELTVYHAGEHYDIQENILKPSDIGKGKHHLDFSFEDFEYYEYLLPIIP